MGIFTTTVTDYVRRGDLAGAEQAILKGDDVNERRGFQQTPIMNASRNHDIVLMLLRHGADVNAIDSNTMTVLFHTIHNSNEPSALAILDHDVHDLDAILWCGRTVLHEAVRRGLAGVVKELLDRGANPWIREYNGSNNPMAIELIKETQGDVAVAIRQVLTEYTSFAAAVAARNKKAIFWTLGRGQQAFSGADWDAFFPYTDDVRDDVPLHRWIYLTLAQQTYDNFLYALEFAAALVDTGLSVNTFAAMFRFQPHQWSLLHVAARYQFPAAVKYLLVECKMDPRIVDANGQRPIDLVDTTDRNGKQIHFVLTQCMRRLDYAETSSKVLSCRDNRLVTLEELQPLAESVTSVYDLRVVVSLGISMLPKADVKQLLLTAFAQVITDKLAYQDRDAVFFKLVLRECHRLELLTDVEFTEWDLKTNKVNMESSKWVDEIKQSIADLQWRVDTVEHQLQTLQVSFNQLRQALIEKQELEERAAKVKQVVSLFTAALTMCGGPVIEKFFDSVMDFSDPLKLLVATFNVKQDDVVKFLAEKTTDALRDGVAELLEKAAIDPKDFAEVLREAVELDQLKKQEQLKHAAEAQKELTLSLAGLAVSNTAAALSAPVSALTMQKRKKISFRDVVKLYKAQLGEQEAPTAPSAALVAPSTPTETVDDLQEYPYHYAVQYCGGDMTKFHEIIDYIEEDDGDINATASVLVFTDKTHTTSEVKAVSATVYASYLGYVDVVKFLFNQPSVQPEEKKFVIVGRAQARAIVQ